MMQRFNSTAWITGLLIVSFIGCTKKEVVKTADTTPPVAEEQKVSPPPAPEPTVQEQTPPVVTEAPAASSKGLEDVYFDFDKSAIRNDMRETLTANAQWLLGNPGVKVRIEGYCDERGTNEYNLALGERRAQSAKQFMVAMGVDSGRISTISYGEERAVCTEHHEDCWWKNRRARFSTVNP
jgi:peptidoglycan-associated lipoprotein